MTGELHNDCDGGQCVACARKEAECENCMRLIGQVGALEDANERLMEQIIKRERNAEQMMLTLGDQAATIRRLTEERLGPEKSLYEQMREEQMRGITPQGTGDSQIGGMSQLDPDKGFIK